MRAAIERGRNTEPKRLTAESLRGDLMARMGRMPRSFSLLPPPRPRRAMSQCSAERCMTLNGPLCPELEARRPANLSFAKVSDDAAQKSRRVRKL